MHAIPLAALAAALLPLPAPHQQAPEPDAAIVAYLEDRFAATGVPGAAYAVVDLDGGSRTYAWGEDGDGDPVDAGTAFLWGSVAKPVTATAAMTLVEDGRLDLDAPVTDYLPDFTLAGGANGITTRDLLEQTSGIPEGTGITDRFDHREDPFGDAVADLAGVEPLAEAGEAFEYASANYVVVGAVVEAASGMPYEEYLRAAVLEPLGMDGAVATEEAAESLPDGHTAAFGQAVPVPAYYDQTGPSYGYLGGTVTDLQRFAEAHLGNGLISPESLALMHTGAAEVNDTIDYGLGWRVDARNADLGTGTVWHTGAAPGFAAGVILLPEHGKALVVAQNRYAHFEGDALIGTMLGAARLLAGGEPDPIETGPLYPALLIGLGVLVLAALAAVVLTLVRIRRSRKPLRRKWTGAAGIAAWWALAALVAYTAWDLVPGLAPSATLFRLFAPDIAWLLTALAAAALLLAAARTWKTLLRRQKTTARESTT
ncbi:CubicO group peptidase, beta-lactamase class C family [Glycomyces sambucus]|uniref:CubicO group peptidase, beta-lactamase class C family n=1 Tax=Glycomyces sambucus TaxID=380244 RepID=A0A1G9I451_9ACTN|nr:serine hydrolase domain-containing protein [Glycomyces sambucus]SDL20017.1 CubicO group peptidase, beta-lactamase class C family [Glycomyces sambucus]